MKAAVRCASLTLGGSGPKTLESMEAHGKREDKTSKLRQIRKVDPIVYGSLNLRVEYDAHVKGAHQNAGSKRPVLHFLIKFPDEILTDAAPETYIGMSLIERKKLMLVQAVEFINRTHGGDAVFAGRVDLDEVGEMVVDIFAAPKYQKHTQGRNLKGPKGPKVETWASATKFGKELAVKHQVEIQGRTESENNTIKTLTRPRDVGIALQAEFAEFFEIENGVKLTRNVKNDPRPDRVETEAFKKIKQAEAAVELAVANSKLGVQAAKADADRITSGVAALVAEVDGDTIGWHPDGKIKIGDRSKLLPVISELGPAIRAAADLGRAKQSAAAQMADADKRAKGAAIELEMRERFVTERELAASQSDRAITQREADLESGWAKLDAAWVEVDKLRSAMKQAYIRVVGWLRRPDLPPAAKAAAVEIIKQDRHLVVPARPDDQESGPSGP